MKSGESHCTHEVASDVWREEEGRRRKRKKRKRKAVLIKSNNTLAGGEKCKAYGDIIFDLWQGRGYSA